ncbi:MAG: bifunctional riboflavin kinase/FAD synthetase [Bdellovibrionales bacterium]|nr:bifunctional riboflavin kinase/FAD synthetase [Bdellovibrionales bacterium]
MKVVQGISEIKYPLKGSVLTIGNFDGVHIGHQQLIAQVVEKAKKNGLCSVIITFAPHPSKVLRPESPVAQLFPVEDMAKQMEKMGVDVLIVEPFDLKFSQLSAAEFIGQRVTPVLCPKEIIVGYDFAFGRGREGSFDNLLSLSKKYSFDLSRLDPVTLNGEIVSSSRVRELLKQGDVDQVSMLLGRPFYLSGIIERGEGRGEKLGFPTANLNTQFEVLPAIGVYITYFIVDDEYLPSLTNVGRKPTFHDSHEISIETFVLDKGRSFYGESSRIQFLSRIRPELKFSSARELICQIDKDVNVAKKYFGL